MRRSLRATLGVLLVLAAILAGSLIRDRIEFGARQSDDLGADRPGRYASLEPQSEPSESELYYQMVQLLKREFVDPISDEEKLALGAVRGMIGSLLDPWSMYLDPTEFRAFQDRLAGKYAGIGIEARMRFSPEQIERLRTPEDEQDAATLIPDVVITAVAPGSPAALAGLKPGDRIDSVNGRWLPSARQITDFRDTVAKLQNDSSDPDAAAKLDKYRNEFRVRAEKTVLPIKALDQLTTGVSGTVSVGFERQGKIESRTIARRLTQVSAVSSSGKDAIGLRFFVGAPESLRSRLSGQGELTLDLRNSGMGSFEAMRRCLSMLVPSGTYGSITKADGSSPRPLTIAQGSQRPPQITLLVDETTEGAAHVFALALQTSGRANIEGRLRNEAARVVNVYRLPDGSGYTLVTGLYSTKKVGGSSRSGK